MLKKFVYFVTNVIEDPKQVLLKDKLTPSNFIITRIKNLLTFLYKL